MTHMKEDWILKCAVLFKVALYFNVNQLDMLTISPLA